MVAAHDTRIYFCCYYRCCCCYCCCCCRCCCDSHEVLDGELFSESEPTRGDIHVVPNQNPSFSTCLLLYILDLRSSSPPCGRISTSCTRTTRYLVCAIGAVCVRAASSSSSSSSACAIIKHQSGTRACTASTITLLYYRRCTRRAAGFLGTFGIYLVVFCRFYLLLLNRWAVFI